jgi:hypothetical protein
MTQTMFYFFLFIHLISLVVGFGAVIVIDSFGLLWLLKWWGVDLNAVRRTAAITQRLIWLGFTGLVISGTAMLIYIGRITDEMWLKLFLVALVGLNGIFLHTIKKGLDSLGENITEVPAKYYFRIGLASTISQVGWWGATIIGFFHHELPRALKLPINVMLVMGIVLFVIGLVAIIGERATANKQ